MCSSYNDVDEFEKDFQKVAQQAVLGSVSADWKAYKEWCEENGKRPSDPKILNYYVKEVFKGGGE